MMMMAVLNVGFKEQGKIQDKGEVLIIMKIRIRRCRT